MKKNVVIHDTRESCKYGTSCYRKTFDHLRFSHSLPSPPSPSFPPPPALYPSINDEESDERVKYLENLLFSKDDSNNGDADAIKRLARKLEASVSFLYYHAF